MAKNAIAGMIVSVKKMIRLANKNDLEHILDYFKENDKIDEQFVNKRVNYFLDNNIIAIAEENHKIVGHTFIQIKENPILGVAEFEAVHINEKYRGKGIGSELIKKSIEFTKNYFEKIKVKPRCLYLMTRSNNYNAQKIYEKVGFKSIGKVGKIFIENEPEEILMTYFF